MGKSDRDQETTMKVAKALGLLLDLLILGASLATGGNVGDGIRAIGAVVAAIIGALVIFCAVCLTLGILAQREPPYHG
jgi:hypothetical protein